MDRETLEQEILERMPTLRPVDIPTMKKALALKTTVDLEDLLERVKKAGR